MHEEQESDAPASPSRVMRRFVHCVDEGDVRRDLADDCILGFLGRSIKGGTAATGYVRTQLTGRFKHVGFQNARHCSPAHETLLKDRFQRSFQVLRRQLKAPKDMQPSLHSRADSEDEVDETVDVAARPNPNMVTPPRSTAVNQSSDLVHYIESVGVLEAQHDHNDGGISLGESCHVMLTLGYRCSALPYKRECAVEICLVVYEKFRQKATTRTSGIQRFPRHQRSPRNAHTDDEGEVQAPRSVRRTLFASADCEDSEESLDVTPPAMPALTPRKRQHKSDANVKTKRPTVHGGMRF